MRKIIAVLMVAAVMSISTAMFAFAGWYQEDGHWKYRDDAKPKFQ